MNQSDLVSIIIPTFNRQNTIKLCLQLCLDQTHENIEILVIDDGSTDKTEDVVRSMNNEKIRYFKIPNSGGPARPRNIGIENAKGDWLAFLDSDDYWKKDKLSEQLRIARQENKKFVTSNAYCDNTTKLVLNLNGNQKLNFCKLLKNNYIVCSSVLIHKDVIKNDRFDETSIIRAYEDYLLWLCLTINGEEPFYIKEPLLNYTMVSSDSLRFQNILRDSVKYKYIYDLLKSREKKLKNGIFLCLFLLKVFLRSTIRKIKS